MSEIIIELLENLKNKIFVLTAGVELRFETPFPVNDNTAIAIMGQQILLKDGNLLTIDELSIKELKYLIEALENNL